MQVPALCQLLETSGQLNHGSDLKAYEMVIQQLTILSNFSSVSIIGKRTQHWSCSTF